MQHPLLDVVEKKYNRANPLNFNIGEDVVVTLKIVEGGRERLQDFEGTVIARKGSGLDEMFTVRRIVANQGVERTFPIHSPRIVSIKTVRTGKVRRCKLYYLRDRVGKARRLRAKYTSAASRKAAAETRRAKAEREREAAEIAAAAQADASASPDTEMATA
ncbi:MAG: 50S ribosomal protein L19 [Planctomycetota bacterium]|nr:MAG: 50S ribosomal protein L19 [Planctomycetota bacterium]